MNNKFYVPISEKVLLTVEEAAFYSNIDINKISKLLNNPLCEFVLYVGKKRLVKRKEFEKYIEKTLKI
ncbi:MAG: excisionase [Clostridia bacterium]|nr:excisionase [Clostridia bacterium]